MIIYVSFPRGGGVENPDTSLVRRIQQGKLGATVPEIVHCKWEYLVLKGLTRLWSDSSSTDI